MHHFDFNSLAGSFVTDIKAKKNENMGKGKRRKEKEYQSLPVVQEVPTETNKQQKLIIR